MKSSVQRKLDGTTERFEEVGHLLSDPVVIGDQNRFRDLSREYARLEPVVQCYQQWQAVNSDRDEARAMLEESDPEMQALGKAELASANTQLETLELDLQKHLLPRDPRDSAGVYLEVRAGTGGDEAALFSGDLFNMYRRYAEGRGWQVETISTSDGDVGGYKEIIARIIGNGVFSRLKFEAGVHRVQRVPDTESQGRIHTSACTVAILAEVEELQEIEIKTADLRIDTFRASGAGGQHVNKTDSAIRLTHIPSGVVVECQEERSQHKNRAKAMSLLKARLLNAEQEKRHEEEAKDRKSQVGSGDRSERIRTYNFPQGRVTDHRINLTLYKLDQILAGEVDMVIDPLLQEHQAAQLANLSHDSA